MDHPNIVRFHNHIFLDCPDQPGVPGYLVMKTEYLDMDLSKVTAIRCLTLEELKRMAVQVGRGLNWMHEKRVVHHDLKTDNIMCKWACPVEHLTKETIGAALATAVFKIIDFNISMQYSENRFQAQESQYSAGTPGYRVSKGGCPTK